MLKLNRLKGIVAITARTQNQLFNVSPSTLRHVSTIRMIQPLQSNKNTLLSPIKSNLDVIKTEYSSAAPAASASTNLWIAERAVSVALIGLFPLALAIPCKPLDILVSVTLVAHTYWGFEAIITEYVRPLLFGSVVPKVAHVLLIALMMATLGGLFYLIFDDIGVAGAVRRLWTIKSKPQ